MSMLIVDLDTYYEEIEKTLGDLKDETPKVLSSRRKPKGMLFIRA